jgi:hypothetical protein
MEREEAVRVKVVSCQEHQSIFKDARNSEDLKSLLYVVSIELPLFTSVEESEELHDCEVGKLCAPHSRVLNEPFKSDAFLKVSG